MPRGVRLTVLGANGGRTEHEFARFPVRIGRNALNDLHIADGTISQFHALLELGDKGLTVRDLGSKNGTAVPGMGRLQPNTTASINDGYNEFYVAQFFVRCELVEFSSESLSNQQAARMHRTLQGERVPDFRRPPTEGEMRPVGGSSEDEPRTTFQHRTPSEAAALAENFPESREPVTQQPPRRPPSQGRMPVANRPAYAAEEHEPPSGRTMPHGNVFAIRFAPLFQQYRKSWHTFHGAVEQSIGHLDDELREQAYEELVRAFPGIENEPEFSRFREPSIPIVEEPTAASQGSTQVRATVALNGLTQLAQSYFEGSHELRSADDVSSFLERLFEVLDLFFRCFIPLRDGFQAFTTQLDLGKTRGADGAPSLAGRPTINTANTTTELGSVLLDWKRPVDPSRPQPTQLIEWVFADLMIHHMAMITGVMTGVKSLLSELSPATIEKSFDNPKRGGGGGLQIGPFRYKQLWELYATRHSDLADEDKEAFALIFGGDFARAYSQLATETQATAAIRMSAQFPTRTPSHGTNPGLLRDRLKNNK